jgi:hypothetical protein
LLLGQTPKRIICNRRPEFWHRCITSLTEGFTVFRVCLVLQVIEGMGRAIHTNLRTPFKCDTLKLAMIKTERLAVKLFSGSLYDCMCSFQRAPAAGTAGTAAAGHRAGGAPSGKAPAVGFSTEQ